MTEQSFTVRTFGEMLPKVPAMLGFIPTRSLVLVTLTNIPDRPDSLLVDTIARVDLGDDCLSVSLDLAASVALRAEAGILAVVIDDRLTVPEPGTVSAPHPLIDALHEALPTTPIRMAVATTALETGAAWWDLLGSTAHGTLTNPMAEPLALAAIVGGRIIRRDRAELEQLIEPDLATRDHVARLLPATAEAAAQRLASAIVRNQPEHYTREVLGMVRSHIDSVAAGAVLLPQDFADIAIALRDYEVRDELLTLADGEHAHAAEDFWSLITRSVPDPDRATAATMFGVTAYVRGEGPTAAIALTLALTIDPDHNLARLLLIALEHGIRPEQIRARLCGGPRTE